MGIGVGLIGSGFIGKVHALAYRAAPAVFGFEPPRLEMLADVDAGAVEAARADLAARHGADVVRCVSVDVTDEERVDAAFEAAALEYGGLDVVVSNAGLKPTVLQLVGREHLRPAFADEVEAEIRQFDAERRAFVERLRDAEQESI